MAIDRLGGQPAACSLQNPSGLPTIRSARSQRSCVEPLDLASVSAIVRSVSSNMRRTVAPVSINLRRKRVLIARRAVHHCASLHIYGISAALVLGFLIATPAASQTSTDTETTTETELIPLHRPAGAVSAPGPSSCACGRDTSASGAWRGRHGDEDCPPAACGYVMARLLLLRRFAVNATLYES